MTLQEELNSLREEDGLRVDYASRYNCDYGIQIFWNWKEDNF